VSAFRLTLIFLAVFVAAAVAGAPMRLALAWSGADAAGLAARRVEGPIWSGTLHDASLRGVPIGRVEAAMDPSSITEGATTIRFSADGAVRGAGRATLGEDRFGLRDAKIETPLALAVPGAPLRGRLRLEDATIRFREGRCVEARGMVRVDQLGLYARGPSVPGLTLAGQAACRDSVVYIPLNGTAPGVRFAGALRIDGQGGYRLESRIFTDQPAIEGALGLSGFGRAAGGFARTDTGRLGG
jgi:general secretion pathway protein N